MSGTGARIAIGVTGHRHYDDPSGVAESVNAVLDRVLTDGRQATVITSLAEGADRLVASLVIARGGTIDVVLPLPADDYEHDFATPASRADFRSLLAAAATVEVVGPGSAAGTDAARVAAYERAGRTMVHRSDVVIAVWDGAPARGRGGTAEIIQHALDHDVLVEVVLVERSGGAS